MTSSAVRPIYAAKRRGAESDGADLLADNEDAEVTNLQGEGLSDEYYEGFMEADEAEVIDESESREKPKIRVPEDRDAEEAQDPRFKCTPCLPTSAERAAHDVAHLPYRNWCPVCVRAKAREDAHWRHQDGHDEEHGLPVISIDYELLEEKVTMLVAKDDQSGSVLCYDCVCKGPTDEWLVKQFVADIDSWGRKDICLKSDGEPAIVALQAEVARRRDGRTVPINPPAYDPQGNGPAEKAVQDVTGHVRCLKLALEARIKCNLDAKHPVITWMMRHAAFLLTRLSKGHDGMTSWRRLMKRNYYGLLTEFGESVWGKLQLKKSPIRKKVKRGKQKLVERSVLGTWVGIYPRTGENIIVKENGDVVRVRTITRRPDAEKFDAERILAIKALPRMPTPTSRRRQEDIPGQLNEGQCEDAAGPPQRDDHEAPQEGGAGIGRPEVEPREEAPRDFRIDQRLLDKFDYTAGCPGCIYKREGFPDHRGHTPACRRRLQDLMIEDENELDILNRKEERMKKKARPDIPRATTEDGGRPRNAPPYCPEPGARRDSAAPADAAPVAGAPEDDVNKQNTEGAADADLDMPTPREDTDEEINNEPNENVETDDPDDIPEGLFEPDSEDEGAKEPSAKRQRAQWIGGSKSCLTSIGRTLAGQADVLGITEPKHNIQPQRSSAGITMQLKQQINNINAIRQCVDVKKVIQDLEKLPKFKLNAKGKRELRHRSHGADVAEVYSPPRITKLASDMNLKAAWALDLTVRDPDDDQPWDLSDPGKQAKTKKKINEDKPLMLVVCPMCGPFSTMMNWNYAAMETEQVREILDKAMEHLKFALELCVMQHQAGRLFLFEHPVGASSWETEMIRTVASLEGVHLAKFDFCQLDMKTKGKDGSEKPAKKRTTVLTNSQHVAKVLREAQCDGSHVHQQLVDGRAGPCQEYPEKFCRVVCQSIKREIDDIRWRKRLCRELDITQSLSAMIAATEKAEQLEIVPEERLDFDRLYHDCEFYDDASGLQLDKGLATRARETEMKFFKDMGVYSKVKRASWMKVIATKWLDINKGDIDSPNYRARLVGCELKGNDKRDDLFAATPPLESLKAILSMCASRQGRRHPHRIMSVDVKRAYFYAPATRPIYIRIPKEDWEDGDEERVGMLHLSLYGTRDAALNWSKTYTGFLVANGFVPGRCSPCNFHHPQRDIAMTVHGDDFTCSGSEQDLWWLEGQFKAKFEVKCEVLGPRPGAQSQEIRVLNRVLTWTDAGLCYEPDQRHAEIVIRDLGLTGGKAVSSPGSRDDANRASSLGLDLEDPQTPLLSSREASSYRAISARLNYLAQDRADLQYACKEASRRMARPRVGDMGLLKRIGRYLLGAPRFKQMFFWQDETDRVDTFTDSDWAGCRSTARSTSGGAVKIGFHCIKTWSTTQAVVALSSAEAELYALTKGASQALGAISLFGDFGEDMEGMVHTDASAALGIVKRQGLGKLRHLRVQYLWIQDKVRGGDLEVHKILGTKNPADLMTKHLAAHDAQRHLEEMAMKTSDDRASTAPTLNNCNETQHDNKNKTEHEQNDHWKSTTTTVTRIHAEPRRELFTPVRVAGAPSSTALTPVRITTGKFVDTGEEFQRIDTWTARTTAHLCLGRRWKGTTEFIMRVDGDLVSRGDSS